MKLLSSVIFFMAATLSFAISLRGAATAFSKIALSQRLLQQSYYYTTSDAAVLGLTNVSAAMGNPLKGLLTSPRWTGLNAPDSIPSSLEFYYLGLDEVLTANNTFDWTALDDTLASAASRNKHVIWRIFCHYPGEPLRVPQYLIDAGVKLVNTTDGVSPQYDDPILLQAFQQFIMALGQRYDGNTSLGFIQLGLLGKWGEWHTYPDNNLLSDSTKDKIVGWYSAAFSMTQLQVRNPLASAYAAGMGLHDDSFAFSTIGPVDWFFMPTVEKAGLTSFWKKGAMGGETRPELQSSIFESGYQPGLDVYKQDFDECVDVTHATYMIHNDAFTGSGYTGTELVNARDAHARMGYNFQVMTVGVASSSPGTVVVDVTVKQTGVAPFYYPLGLTLSCPGTIETLGGVNDLVEFGSSKVFSFRNIPADSACLETIAISLDSEFTYVDRPVKFAQGMDGKVSFSLPLPPVGGDIATSASFPSFMRLLNWLRELFTWR